MSLPQFFISGVKNDSKHFLQNPTEEFALGTFDSYQLWLSGYIFCPTYTSDACSLTTRRSVWHSSIHVTLSVSCAVDSDTQVVTSPQTTSSPVCLLQSISWRRVWLLWKRCDRTSQTSLQWWGLPSWRRFMALNLGSMAAWLWSAMSEKRERLFCFSAQCTTARWWMKTAKRKKNWSNPLLQPDQRR